MIITANPNADVRTLGCVPVRVPARADSAKIATLNGPDEPSPPALRRRQQFQITFCNSTLGRTIRGKHEAPLRVLKAL